MITLVELKTVANYIGLSTDEKPEQISDAAGMPNGSRFLEMDTGIKYFWNADTMEWIALPESSGGGGTAGGEIWEEISNAQITVNITGATFDGSILTNGKIVIVNGKVNIANSGNVFSADNYISPALTIKKLPKPTTAFTQRQLNISPLTRMEPDCPWIETEATINVLGWLTIALKTEKIWQTERPAITLINIPTIVYVRADALG